MKYLIISLTITFLASFLPRAIPITLIKKRIKSDFIQSFLFYVPYAVIASLTFPYVLYSTGNFYISLVGASIAIILSLLKQKMVVVAVGAVVIVYILLLII